MTKTVRTINSVASIRKYLMSKIDTSDPVEVEKVGRYVKQIEMYRRMEKTIKDEGVSVTTVNGSQSFVKSHPLLAEMNRVNTSIINIERTMNFIDKPVVEDTKYTTKDLI